VERSGRISHVFFSALRRARFCKALGGLGDLAMTFGTTKDKPWIEAILTDRGPQFSGRTFSRFHIVSNSSAVPTVGEIWATSDHAVESHAHDSDELLYVLSGVIEINGQRRQCAAICINGLRLFKRHPPLEHYRESVHG